jgi:hypothetical protein
VIEDGMMVMYLGWVGESETMVVQALEICDGASHSRGQIHERSGFVRCIVADRGREFPLCLFTVEKCGYSFHLIL